MDNGENERTHLYLFECSLSIKQVVDHVGRHADERRHADAVAQNRGPQRVVVVEQPHLRGESQETNDDELCARVGVKRKVTFLKAGG